MSRDPGFDILFEPLHIGPVNTKNRFYQVPHCTGMGWQRPNMLNKMGAMKAEGGYANLRSSVPDEQMHITRNLEDAFSKCEEIINS